MFQYVSYKEIRTNCLSKLKLPENFPLIEKSENCCKWNWKCQLHWSIHTVQLFRNRVKCCTETNFFVMCPYLIFPLLVSYESENQAGPWFGLFEVLEGKSYVSHMFLALFIDLYYSNACTLNWVWIKLSFPPTIEIISFDWKISNFLLTGLSI